MLPIERQNRIREIIKEKQHIKIADLSKLFGVSEMTIHRDLKPLLDDGFIIKTFGGITYNRIQASPLSTDRCIYCSRNIHGKMAYRLILADNTIEMACCAHCGLLRHRQLKDQDIQAICHDFLKQTTISAPLAFYVMDTSIDMGCCQPQVLSFEWEEHARKFVKGFGGNVYIFKDAMEMVYQKMNGNSTCCQRE